MTETQVAVIIERLDHVIRRIDDLDDKSTRIEAQATRTNGRVTDLEKWKARIVGAIGMATFILGFVMPILMLFLRKYL